MGEGLKYRWKMGDRFTRKTADARKMDEGEAIMPLLNLSPQREQS